MVGSTGRCNGLGKGSGWCFVAKGFSRPGVEPQGDRVEIILAVHGQIRSPGQVLPQKAVGVLVAAPLPGAAGITELYRNIRRNSETLVLGQLHSGVQVSDDISPPRKLLDLPDQRINHALSIFAIHLGKQTLKLLLSRLELSLALSRDPSVDGYLHDGFPPRGPAERNPDWPDPDQCPVAEATGTPDPIGAAPLDG
jgi:hypothetical protein